MNKENFGISIVILTCRRNDELLNAVISCIKNVDSIKEIIIVDNAAGEARHIVEKLRDKYQYILFKYIVFDENTGVSNGRNAGYKSAESEYVLFLDDDAVIEKEITYEQIDDIFSTKNISIITGNVSVPSRELIMMPRMGKNGEPLFFIGAAHIIAKSKLKVDLNGEGDLYPTVIHYGHEDLLLSLMNYQRGNSIYFWKDFEVTHYPSTVRTCFIEEQTNGIVNKYLVKKVLFPKGYALVLFMGFIRRNIKLWGFAPNKVFYYMKLVKKRENEMPYIERMSYSQARNLLDIYGVDFLWEISHKDRKEERKWS